MSLKIDVYRDKKKKQQTNTLSTFPGAGGAGKKKKVVLCSFRQQFHQQTSKTQTSIK